MKMRFGKKTLSFLTIGIGVTFLWMMTPNLAENEGADRGHEGGALRSDDNFEKVPSVVIAVLVRNKAHSLPHFFGCLEQFAYPKKKTSFFIRSDHNKDNSIELLARWIETSRDTYYNIDYVLDDQEERYEDEDSNPDWVPQRFQNVIGLREEALAHARQTKANFIFFVDADNLIIQPDVLQMLMKYEKTLVAPMLRAPVYVTNKGGYSNWWGRTTPDGFHYSHSPELEKLYERKETGLFKVAVVHSTFLIDLRTEESRLLSFKPPDQYFGPLDDVVIFNHNARSLGVDIWLSNEFEFGYLPKPYYPFINLNEEAYRHRRIHMEHLMRHPPMPVSQHLSPKYPPKSRLGFDHIYVISLKHRENRRRSIQHTFDVLGIEAAFFDAVDGRKLTKDDVAQFGMRKCRDYRHEAANRDLTYGELGCFLSHYYVWKDAEERGFKRVMIFEDDAALERDFVEILAKAMPEVEVVPDWDLLYLGRSKLIEKEEERPVENTKFWVWPGYSFWAINYALTDRGIKKLMASKPFEKLVALDLLFPVLFGKYPDNAVNRHFKPQNLVALALRPKITYPAQYWGQTMHVSDTDDANTIPKNLIHDSEPFSWDLSSSDHSDLPTVVIALLVRNKKHSLPYLLGILENLHYPKNKISFFIRSDHNVDGSNEMLRVWVSQAESDYAEIDFLLDDENQWYDEEAVVRDWVEERFHHIIDLRQEALEFARKRRKDFIFFIDADNLPIPNNGTLFQLLMNHGKTLVAPLMKAVIYRFSGGGYANFWGNVSEDGYAYRPSTEADDIVYRRKKGLFEVAAVHSTFLIDLRTAESRHLSFRPNPSIYKGPLDDVIIFNFNARYHGVGIWLTNEVEFGWLPKPVFPPNNLEEEVYRHLRLHMEHLQVNPPFPVSNYVKIDHPKKSKLGFDHIYVIHLNRRPERRLTSQHVFDELGIHAKFFEAVEGRSLTSDDVEHFGMRKCKDYRHESGRDLTFGEIGCLMSHYHVWEDALAKGYKKVMVLEDDAGFDRGYVDLLAARMTELDAVTEWDLLYIYKKQKNKEIRESKVVETENWVYSEFNTGTINYIVSETGMKKLLNSEPFSKLVPVDVLFAILCGKYPDPKVNRHYENRNLIALALHNPICWPAQYWIQENFYTDTDNGEVIPPDLIHDNEVFPKNEL